MNLEKSLYYVTHHSESIIQWLFLGILLLTGVIVARGLFGKRESGDGGAGFADSGEIQVALKKILDQTVKLESVSITGIAPAPRVASGADVGASSSRGDGGTGEAAAAMAAELQNLKRELAQREQELNKAKATGAANGGDAVNPATSPDHDKLSARMKELEAKLAEYEILEDDIADLSLYKDENARLRSELDKLKANPAPAAASAKPASSPASPASAASEPVPAPIAPIAPAVSVPPIATASGNSSPMGEEIVAEFAEAVLKEGPSSNATAIANGSAITPAPASPAAAPKVASDPMADFEAALNLDKKMGGVEKAPAVATPQPQPASMVADASDGVQVTRPPDSQAQIITQQEADDLFAEFASPLPEVEPVFTSEVASEGAPEGAPDSLDTNKMMEEMAALAGLESGKPDHSALEENIDTEKMAEEAARLTKTS